jgi:heme-degrading monooxygenase HmoA
MLAVYVTFRLGARFDAEALQRIAAQSAPRFASVPGLRSKTFTVNPARCEAVNVYLWESEAAARAFFTADAIERVSRVYGVRPDLDFAPVVAHVPS